MFFEEGGDAGEEGDVVVGVDAEVAGGDAAFGADGGGFGDDGAGSADGAGAEVDEVPVVGVAVGGAVLAHGRDDDAVGEGDAALRERGEEGGGREGHGGLDVASVREDAVSLRRGGLWGASYGIGARPIECECSVYYECKLYFRPNPRRLR